MVQGYRLARDTTGRAGAAVCRLHGKANAPDLFLKYGEGSVAEDINEEQARLIWLAGHISVPTVLQFCRTSNQAWLLTTAIRGQSAFQALKETPKSGLAIVDALAEFLKQFHAIPVDGCPFDSRHAYRLAQARQRIEADLVDVDDFDDERQGWTTEQVWAAIQEQLPFEPDSVVTHGDFSLDNLLVSQGKVVGCIDVGRAGVADRYQDLAILCNAVGEFGSHLRERLLHAYGIASADQRKLQFHMMLDELF